MHHAVSDPSLGDTASDEDNAAPSNSRVSNPTHLTPACRVVACLVALAWSFQVAVWPAGAINVTIPGTDGNIVFSSAVDSDYSSATVWGEDFLALDTGFVKDVESDGRPVFASAGAAGNSARAKASIFHGQMRAGAWANTRRVIAGDHWNQAVGSATVQSTQILLVDFGNSSVPIETVQLVTADLRLTGWIAASFGERLDDDGLSVALTEAGAGVSVSFEGPDSRGVSYTDSSRVNYFTDYGKPVHIDLDSVRWGDPGSSESTSYEFSAPTLPGEVRGFFDISFSIDLQQIPLLDDFDPSTGTSRVFDYSGDGPTSNRFAAYSWTQGLAATAGYSSSSFDVPGGNSSMLYDLPAALDAMNTLVFSRATLLDGSSLESHEISLYHVNEFSAAVPEPSSLVLFLAGGLIGAIRYGPRRRLGASSGAAVPFAE